MPSSIPVVAAANWSACRLLIGKWRSARLLCSSFLVLAGFAFATILGVTCFAESNPPLNFGNNFFVTGDYVVAGAYFMNVNVGNGYATGTIAIPDVNPGITGAKFVPAGAEVVAAVLYWQTVEKTGVVPGQPGSGENGFFRPVFKGGPQTGYPITGVNLGSQDTVSYSPGGCTNASTGKVVRTYRANVLGALPHDATGNISANGTYEVRLPSTGYSTPYTLGASLVLIYRILSPSVPLNSIVIYDGAFGQNNSSLNMTQTVQGFYQAAAKPISRLTHIVGGGEGNKYQTVYLDSIALPSLYGSREPAFPGWYGTWDNPTWTFGASPYPPSPVKANDASATTEVVPYSSQEGCVSWGAVIVSTTVQNSDNDGLLDVWKKAPPGYPNPGYCDAAVNGGVCTPGSSSWVDLPGAASGQKDVFVQLDYMCSSVTGTDSCTTGDGVNYSFDPRPSGAVQMATNGMFAAHNVHVHVNPPGTNQPDVHAIQETTCTDNLTTSPPELCSFPILPGVVAWKGGFDFYKNQLVDPTGEVNDCAVSSPPASCIPRFQPGKRHSWHYVLSAHAVGQPEFTLQDGTLISVAQHGTTVTFVTSTPVGTLDTLTYQGITSPDPYCPNGRVTIIGAATSSNLDGTYCVNSPFNPAGTSFAITVGGSSTNASYTFLTDPNLAVAVGQVNSTSGFSDVGGGDSLIALGLWGNPASPASDGQKVPVIAGTWAHEFGHSNGLTHGGFVFNSLNQFNQNYIPTILPNCAPNHQSVMNYSFQVDLLNNGSGTNVPDYSGQKLNTLNKTTATSNPFTTTAPTYLSTNWYAPYAGVGTAATQHCDGSPITNGAQMVRLTGPTAAFSWLADQDINFDGNTTESLPGFNDWANIDFRQIGATGSNSVLNGAGAQFNGGGGQFNGGGGQFNGGGKQFNGGGGQFNGGGGQFNGGGKQFNGGGEIDVATVNSFTRPPQNLTASEGASSRTITLNWTAPTFGQIGEYKVYQSTAGGPFAVVATVTGAPPPTTSTVTVNCNPSGYSYFVTAVLAGTTQESVNSNTVSQSGQTGQKLTGCYTNTAPGSVALTNLAFTDTSSANTPVQGDNIQITWSLNDDDTGASVSRAAASSALVAIGPIPADPTCSSLAKPPEYLGYSGTYPYPVTTLSTAGSGIVGTGPFAFNWNTTPAGAGCYFFELDLDSHQYEQSTALELLIYVSDSAPHVTTTALPNGTVGNAYTNTIYESGGVSPFAWTYTGSFPSGITGATNGTVSGTTCVAGNYSFTAKVTDKNANYGTQALTLQIIQASTTTSVVSSPYPSTYGQAVTFTATVAPQYSCTPTGTVTFYDGATAISNAITLSNATAMFTTSALQLIAGPHSISARYSGDSNFYATGSGGSTATALSQTVNQASTTTSVVPSPTPSTYGQSVTLTATVAPQYAGTPTGTVTFYDGLTAISSPINLSNATASYITTPLQLPAGMNSITAVYSGDSNFYKTGAGGSTATALSQTVIPATTATSVSSSLNPSTYGDLVTFTAVVSNASGTLATPTGSVQFVIDSGSAISGTPSACPTGAPAYSLCATTSTSSLTVHGSPHSVQANYINTDGDFLTSSGMLSQTVNQASSGTAVSTTTRMTLSQTSSNLGDLVTLTATVMDSSNGSTGTPSGLVTFFANGMPIGTGTLAVVTGSDQATFTTSLLPVGSDSITATYQGDTNFLGSATATAAPETVALRATTVGVTPTPNAVAVGQSSTVTVTVTDTGTTNPPGAADSWIAAGTPTTGTTGSTATLFADGMVLVAGGTNSGAAINNAYIYNAVSKTFTATTGSLNTARTGATATLLANGEILIAGGSSDGTAANALNTAELYNPVTGTFTVAGSGSGSVMTAARFGATATLLTNGPVLTNGQVLIAGGENSGGALSSAELYNPATDTFTATTGPLGTARYDAAALLLANGSVLIAGGTGTSPALNSAELYSPSAGTFASTGTMTAARTGATATLLLNGNVLVAGGSSDGSTPLNTAEIYATTGGSFSASNSNLNTARFNGTATPLPNGMVLMVGGATGATAELYDPDSDKFDSTGSLLQADQPSLTATLLNKDHVLITGLTSGGGSPAPDAELYTPSFNPLGTVTPSSSEPTDGFSGTCVLTPSTGSPAASTCTTTVTASNVATSPHTITGTYPADSVHSGTTGSAPLTVNKADTLTTVNSATSPSIYGQQVTFSATVSVVSPGAGSPTGSVQFVVDGSNYGSPVSLMGESASITDSALTAVSHTITAIYGGDGNFNKTGVDSSTATTPTQTVIPAMTATAVSSSLNPSTYGGLVTFTAVVSNASATLATPTGSVQFVIDSGSPISGTPSTCPAGAPPYSSCATTSTSSLTVSGSPHSVVANYMNADGDFATSSGTLSPGQTVNPALNIWFTEANGSKIGAITPGSPNSITEYPAKTSGSAPEGITWGPDGNLWFAENTPNNIGVIVPLTAAITEYPISNYNATNNTYAEGAYAITTGPDGNVWFTESQSSQNTSYVGNITTSGTISLFPTPTSATAPHGITAGPDGNLWFTENGNNSIARVTTSGAVTEFPTPTATQPSGPEGITVGPDGNLWFTESVGNKIGVITPGSPNTITEYALPTAASNPFGITAGPDGNLWFTESANNKIGKITTGGIITEYTIPTASSNPLGIAAGPDGNLWFTENAGNNIGRITPTGTITEFPVPTSGSGPWGITVGQSLAANFVFLTAGAYTGNLGGISGANAICQAEAHAGGLPGTYKAWLSDSPADSPSTTFSQSTIPYYLPDGITNVASSWANLVSSPLGNTIDETPSTAVNASAIVWTDTYHTGSNTGGAPGTSSCNAWTSSSSSNQGVVGYSGGNSDSDTAKFGWTIAVDAGPQTCNTHQHLYCFQQGNLPRNP